MRRLNLFDDAVLRVDEDEPDGYRAPYARVGEAIGAARLAGTVVLLGPGQALCPYHHELAEEEWLLVLAGTPTARTPDGERVLRPGDLVCFPRGPEGAHRIANAAATPARVLVVSERAEVAGTVYPDSGKVGLYAPGERLLFRRADQRDYWDGEPPGAAR